MKITGSRAVKIHVDQYEAEHIRAFLAAAQIDEMVKRYPTVRALRTKLHLHLGIKNVHEAEG